MKLPTKLSTTKFAPVCRPYGSAANRPNLLEPAGGVGVAGGQPVPVRNRFVNTCDTVATVTLHTAEHGVPGARTPLGVVPVNSIHQPPISHMGVCAEERPIMHWVSVSGASLACARLVEKKQQPSLISRCKRFRIFFVLQILSCTPSEFD